MNELEKLEHAFKALRENRAEVERIEAELGSMVQMLRDEVASLHLELSLLKKQKGPCGDLRFVSGSIVKQTDSTLIVQAQIVDALGRAYQTTPFSISKAALKR